MRHCPDCGEDIEPDARRCVCGWQSEPRRKGESAAEREHRARSAAAVQASRDAPGPSSLDLTETQWYAVCKFFPNVARRAKRKMADVGPHNQLDAKVKLNPLFARKAVVDVEARAEREAIQNAERELQELAERRKSESRNIDDVNAELSHR